MIETPIVHKRDCNIKVPASMHEQTSATSTFISISGY